MRQSKALDLTTGSILSALTKLAVPIIGTSFVEMAYSLTDMMWLGRVGADAVAAVGAAGFFTWLASAFLLLAKVGAEVGVAQSIGARDTKRAKSSSVTASRLPSLWACCTGFSWLSSVGR